MVKKKKDIYEIYKEEICKYCKNANTDLCHITKCVNYDKCITYKCIEYERK